MRRRFLIPVLIWLAVSPADAAGARWTAGPLALCESQAIVLTAHNRTAKLAPLQLELLDAESGKPLDYLLSEALAYSADQLSYYQDRIANEAYLDTGEQEEESGCGRPRWIVARASSPSQVEFAGFVRGPQGDQPFAVDPMTADEAGRFTSSTMFVEGPGPMLLALANLAGRAATLTYEIANPVSGAVLARRTVRLERLGSPGGLLCGGACEFLEIDPAPQAGRARVTPVRITALSISEEPFAGDIAITLSSASADHKDVQQWKLIQAMPMK